MSARRDYRLEILFRDDTKISIPLDPCSAGRADQTAAFSKSGYPAGWLPFVEGVLEGIRRDEIRYIYVIRDFNVVFRAEMVTKYELTVGERRDEDGEYE